MRLGNNTVSLSFWLSLERTRCSVAINLLEDPPPPSSPKLAGRKWGNKQERGGRQSSRRGGSTVTGLAVACTNKACASFPVPERVTHPHANLAIADLFRDLKTIPGRAKDGVAFQLGTFSTPFSCSSFVRAYPSDLAFRESYRHTPQRTIIGRAQPRDWPR